MNVLAAQPLCRELFALSAWDDTGLLVWRGDGASAYLSHDHSASSAEPVAPAYTLDYIWRRLPKKVRASSLKADRSSDTGEWFAGYWQLFFANEASDAFCRVAIWLFQKGYLLGVAP